MISVNRRLTLQALSIWGFGSCALTTLVGCERPEAAFKNTDITGVDYAKTLVLPDALGKQRDLNEFKGKVVVVFFGYTQCPDVCPTTMLELAQVRRELGADGNRLQAIFVTIDPERDTPEVLQAYVGAFDPSFIALRGDLDQTAVAAKEFKAFFAKVPGKTPQTYTMDHSVGNYVFDTRGKVRLYVRNGSGVPAWVADIKALLAQA